MEGSPWDGAARELEVEPGGLVNIGWHCSDRICLKGHGHRVALVWEGTRGRERSYTFDDVRRASNAVGLFLRSLGLGAGDRVCLFMDKIPELYLSFLGVLKTGLVAQPLFSAFGDESLRVRLADAETRTIVTQRRHLGKVRRIRDALPGLSHVVVVDDDGSAPLQDREVAFHLDDVVWPDRFDVHPTTAESPSLLLYTSGTTGPPKGVQHVHGSLLSQYLTAKEVLDLRADDVYWCTADPGWVTGTSYGIIGPWSLGVTQCVLEKAFSPEAWYGFIEKHRITVWYTAPTAIRSLMKGGAPLAATFDLSSLRHLASVGEPLNPEAVVWSQKVFGRPFHDTYWQTETGCIIIANRPGMAIKPGSMGTPVPGITAAVVDPGTFEPYPAAGRVGLIAVRPGWPSMLRGYWRNDEAFSRKFRNGWYLTGDRARVDHDGYVWFVGRDDDIINTAGHLVSPFEVESALLEHPAVAESAVVGIPDEVNLEVVKAFIALKPGHTADVELELDIMNHVRTRVSPLAMPQRVAFVDQLPRTRSGKIMRRMLRAREWGRAVGDTSTLDDE